jgi:hypothetical protein
VDPQGGLPPPPRGIEVRQRRPAGVRADKVHNAEAILADLQTHGPARWARSPGKLPEDDLSYYGRLAAFFDDVLTGEQPPLARRLQATVDALGPCAGSLLSGRH